MIGLNTRRRPMQMRTSLSFVALAVVALLADSARADREHGLTKGTPEITSAGPMAFGPDGILFVADPRAAAIFAIDTGDRNPGGTERPRVDGLDEKIASLLGIEAKQLQIVDLAVNPVSGNTYLSVFRGKGPESKPVIIRVDRTNKVSEFPLKDVKFAVSTLSNAAEGTKRLEAITHIGYVDGKVFVAGLSNEEFASKLRSIPFPFTTTDKGASVEIYHGSHGRVETASPVRTFVACDIKGEANLLCAYTCTPLVKIPVAQLKAGEKVKGVTVAELGNMNRPLDMIVYTKDGKEYILMANSARGVMKIPTAGIDKVEAITSRVSGKAGATYETIQGLKGVVQLDRFDKDHVLILVHGDNGYNLETIELP
jgi:hypothetical protein